MDRLIYLDNSATTSLCPEAVAAMNDAVRIFANPSSLHSAGAAAAGLLENSRKTLLKAAGLGGKFPAIFTGSGSEANNLAILGAARTGKHFPSKRIIITDSEHPSVENSALRLEKEGFEVAFIPTRGGKLDEEVLENELKKGAAIISLMLVNNETGAIYDVDRAFSEAKRLCPGILCHCDAVQGFMRVSLPKNADMISVSAHKIHGPKGTGALFVTPEIMKKKALSPVIYGGGQEFGLRSGTENTVCIAAFAAAAAAAAASREQDAEKLDALYALTVAEAEKAGARVNVPAVHASHIISVTLPGIKSQTMLGLLSAGGVCVSSGSACSSHDAKISRALKAFGLPDSEADCTVRVSLSAENTPKDIEVFGRLLSGGIARLIRVRR
ncbi:MAG: aminotransferase class V-fold PLP-dependent enzyme [Clostridia bacterium]|nr:aminotransferase class V-fold PLP-dependent enzyme [Clostridia bacterium]